MYKRQGKELAADGTYLPANVSKDSWINTEIETELSMQSYLDRLDEDLSQQPGFKKTPAKMVKKCRTTSKTDPDLSLIHIFFLHLYFGIITSVCFANGEALSMKGGGIFVWSPAIFASRCV